jgi:hypothetical protein
VSPWGDQHCVYHSSEHDPPTCWRVAGTKAASRHTDMSDAPISKIFASTPSPGSPHRHPQRLFPFYSSLLRNGRLKVGILNGLNGAIRSAEGGRGARALICTKHAQSLRRFVNSGQIFLPFPRKLGIKRGVGGHPPTTPGEGVITKKNLKNPSATLREFSL